MRRRCMGWFVTLWIVCGVCAAKEIKVHGFVTAVTSPTTFEIDDYKITRDRTFSLELAKEGDDASVSDFKPDDIRIGTEVEVSGEYDPSTGILTPKSIKVFFDDTKLIKRTALIEQVPSLHKTQDGWAGKVAVDGQKVEITPKTIVTYKPNKSEMKQAKESDAEPSPLTSPNALTLDTFMHYEGVRQSDGSIVAQRVEFEQEELTSGESKMWKHFTPKVKDPDFNDFLPGEVKLHWKTFKTVPSKDAQEYVEALGEKLIPQHQKDLPDGSDLKIPFRFYLVEDESFNATAYPNGVVIVHSGVFQIAQNEAQLAFVLSHEISHAVEKHSWREHEYHRKQLMALRIGTTFVPYGAAAGALAEAGIRNSFARSLENQADRVGMEWMLAAGYDIREAPQVWKALSKKKGDYPIDYFWDNHDNLTTRRSYLMAELKNNYSSVDFSTLKKDSEDFHRIAGIVNDLTNGKKKKKTSGTKAGM